MKNKEPKILNRDHYVAAAKARWDGERKKKIEALASKFEAIIVKSSAKNAIPNEIGVALAKVVILKK